MAEWPLQGIYSAPAKLIRPHEKHPELQGKIPLESVLIHIASPRRRLYQVRVKAQ
jgi:hypothetical protein